MAFKDVVELVGKTIDGAGVAAIVVGAIIATGLALLGLVQHQDRNSVYSKFRRFLGRSILLGLELLVAADIIRTVAIAPTLNSVVVLGGIVLIRTFLSFSLEVEITGRWPWQKPSEGVTTGDSEAP
jgi:uncharacterized membrane protein